MLKDYQRDGEEIFAKEAVWVAAHSSIENVAAAREIAEIFAEKKLVYIPCGTSLFWPFLRMLGAVWTGGYISGVRAERKKHRNGVETVSPIITAEKSAAHIGKKDA